MTRPIETQTLACLNGQHTYSRPARRGVKPASCTDHPVSPADVVAQISHLSAKQALEVADAATAHAAALRAR